MYFRVADILVLAGTADAGGMAPPASTRISARPKCVQGVIRRTQRYKPKCAGRHHSQDDRELRHQHALGALRRANIHAGVNCVPDPTRRDPGTGWHRRRWRTGTADQYLDLCWAKKCSGTQFTPR